MALMLKGEVKGRFEGVGQKSVISLLLLLYLYD